MPASAQLLGLTVFAALLTTFAPPVPAFGAAPALAQGSVPADRQAEADRLLQLGIEQFEVSQFREALLSWEQALMLYRETGDRLGEADTLNNVGLANETLGNYQAALAYYEQSLIITRELGDRAGEADTLNNMGIVNQLLGNYGAALAYYEQSIVLEREVGDRAGEVDTLNNIGIVNQLLGNYGAALAYYEQSLVIKRDTGDRAGEADILNNMGIVNRLLENYEVALAHYEQSLSITRELGDRAGEATTLNNMGVVNEWLENYQVALAYYEQSLTIMRELGDRAGEAAALNNIGNVKISLGNDEAVLAYYEQSLIIQREVGDRAGEASTLANLGLWFNTQNQPELAIVFLKVAVAKYEAIRSDNQALETIFQQSYTDTIAGTYRSLADLLLEQGRIPEAQQVLDLLKVEELREFTQATRATWTGATLTYTDPEQKVVNAHGSLIALGGEVIACEAVDCTELERLYNQLEDLKSQYEDQVVAFNETIRANRAEDDIFQDPNNLSGEAEALLSAYAANGQKAVLLYPFVLEEKLWLVWAAAGGVIGSVEVPVAQGELAATVQRLGELLTSPSQLAELHTTSQQLYTWIIQPLEAELTANDIDHLIFVSDRVTRYIPMAVLYDGQQFLLERFTISTVLAPGLTDTQENLGAIAQSQVLGLGLTRAIADFTPLPAVSDELDEIVRSSDTDPLGIYPGQVFLDQGFTLDALKENVRDYRVLHMATHAAFVPGRAEESFVMLGDGNRLTIADIEAMERRLSNLHLVVLSACQTALGGTAGDGTEIAGISSYFLEKGRAETVVASLWSVGDASTSQLMQRFYELLASGELTKAEALRQAQLSLLYDEDTATRLTATRGGLTPAPRSSPELMALAGYRHPYYWAPFILIGNGL